MNQGPWYTMLGYRLKEGQNRFIGSWTLEKLGQVAEGLAQARDYVPEATRVIAVGDSEYEPVYESWRNLCKLALWMAGNAAAYNEEMVEAVFDGGGQVMRRYFQKLLEPILGSE